MSLVYEELKRDDRFRLYDMPYTVSGFPVIDGEVVMYAATIGHNIALAKETFDALVAEGSLCEIGEDE